MKTLVLSLALCALATAARAYDPVADFSIVSNQNVAGFWSYGQTATLGGAFTLLPNAELANPFNANIESWRGGAAGFGGGFPTIAHNKSLVTQTFLTVTHPADELLFHPGPSGERAVLRFIAPTTATYRFQGLFTGRDSAPATTDVSILLNSLSGAPLFTAGINVSGGGNTAAFDITRVLTAGDTIDFSVGYGNSFYGNDSTGLKFGAFTTVSSNAPEPATLSLGLLGLAPLALLARRRYNRA